MVQIWAGAYEGILSRVENLATSGTLETVGFYLNCFACASSYATNFNLSPTDLIESTDLELIPMTSSEWRFRRKISVSLGGCWWVQRSVLPCRPISL